MQKKDVTEAIAFGMPGVTFGYTPGDPSAELVDLDGLVWPSGSGLAPTIQQVQTWHDSLMQNSSSLEAQKIASRDDLVAQYTIGVNRLNAIITNGPTYTAPQVRDAVVDLAKIQLQVLKLVKLLLT